MCALRPGLLAYWLKSVKVGAYNLNQLFGRHTLYGSLIGSNDRRLKGDNGNELPGNTDFTVYAESMCSLLLFALSMNWTVIDHAVHLTPVGPVLRFQ